MTWQERLFEIEPTLTGTLGTQSIPLTIKGEVVTADDGDVFEGRFFIRVGANEVGSGTKMSDIGDFIGEPVNDRKAGIIKAFTELTRRVPAEEWEDMRKAELLVRYREAEDVAQQRPHAV